MSDTSKSRTELVYSLAAKLETLHATLPQKEQRILELLAVAAADPVTRMGLRASDSLFTRDEEAMIDELLDPPGAEHAH
jgi:hypothetical protein